MNYPLPFGKYLLLERANVGGMAEVFRAKAFGVEGFERILAIKRILPNMAEDDEFINMFVDEARIAVQLSHANVVQIYELGKFENQYYIAMEYIAGKDLRQILDQDAEAAGVLDNLVIGGLYKEAPEDRNGPEIRLAFDGKSFDEGDYISRQPTLKATISDQSGINVFGNRGHNIILLIDKTEAVILTDRFRTINGFTTGVLEYDIPSLAPKEHTFELSVHDSYNNATKISVQAFVVGSETGDISINKLLNYPNPMDKEGTTFTFNLTDDARYGGIKIY